MHVLEIRGGDTTPPIDDSTAAKERNAASPTAGAA